MGALLALAAAPLGHAYAATQAVGRSSAAALIMIIFAIVLSLGSLISSVVIYGAIYNLIIPVSVYDLPVYFDYAQGLSASEFPQTPKPPTAHVNLLTKQWESHEKRLNLTSMGYGENSFLLMANIEYDIDLQLRIPLSQKNLELGTFMVKTDILANHEQVKELRDPNMLLTSEQVEDCRTEVQDFQICINKKLDYGMQPEHPSYLHRDVSKRQYDTIASSSRPVTIPYYSGIFFFLWSLLSFAPAALGITDTSMSISLPLIERFKEHPYIRAAKIRVVLSEMVHVAQARIHLTTQLSGLRYYMYNWYFFSAAVGIGILFVIQFAGAFAMFYALWLQCGRPEFSDVQEDSIGYGNNSEELRKASQDVPYGRSAEDDDDDDDDDDESDNKTPLKSRPTE